MTQHNPYESRTETDGRTRPKLFAIDWFQLLIILHFVAIVLVTALVYFRK